MPNVDYSFVIKKIKGAAMNCLPINGILRIQTHRQTHTHTHIHRPSRLGGPLKDQSTCRMTIKRLLKQRVRHISSYIAYRQTYKEGESLHATTSVSGYSIYARYVSKCDVKYVSKYDVGYVSKCDVRYVTKCDVNMYRNVTSDM